MPVIGAHQDNNAAARIVFRRDVLSLIPFGNALLESHWATPLISMDLIPESDFSSQSQRGIADRVHWRGDVADTLPAQIANPSFAPVVDCGAHHAGCQIPRQMIPWAPTSPCSLTGPRKDWLAFPARKVSSEHRRETLRLPPPCGL